MILRPLAPFFLAYHGLAAVFTGVTRLVRPLRSIDIWDLAIIGGASLFCAGLYEIYPPAAKLAGGLILAVLAWWWAPVSRQGGAR